MQSTGGRSDSAIFFAVILQYIGFGFALDEAVAQAVRELRKSYPKSSYNCMIQSQDQFIALCAAGREVTIRESYLGSGAQARAILGGFEADLAALSLDPDIELLRGGELIRHDWRADEYGGMVTRSVVVIGVRAGNPKNIRTWQDLARPGIEVLTPNVRTSGGAMWNVLAIYGAATRVCRRATATRPSGSWPTSCAT